MRRQRNPEDQEEEEEEVLRIKGEIFLESLSNNGEANQVQPRLFFFHISFKGTLFRRNILCGTCEDAQNSERYRRLKFAETLDCRGICTLWQHLRLISSLAFFANALNFAHPRNCCIKSCF